MKLAELKRVVTSKAFIDRARVEVPGAEFVFLEDLRKGIGKVEGLFALLGQRFLPWRLVEAAGAGEGGDEPGRGGGGAVHQRE